MEIYFANTKLCSGNVASGRVGPAGFAVNGTEVNREAPFFRAPAMAFFPGYNRESRITFSVAADYADYESAIAAAADHFAQLPTQGDLVCIGASMQRRLAGAVLDSVNAVQFRGQSFGFEYVFRGGLFATEDIDPPSESDLVKTYNLSLEVGATTHAVVFETPFASAPRGLPQPALSIPADGQVFGLYIDETTRTAAGFTILSDAPVPASGYKASGVAVL